VWLLSVFIRTAVTEMGYAIIRLYAIQS